MKNLLTWLLLIILFGGLSWVIYLALARRAEAGKGMPDYSTYSREKDGLAEFAQLLGKLGYEVIPVTRPIQQTDARGLLILVEPEGSRAGPGRFPGQPPDLSDADVRSLLQWVGKGNTLLLCSRYLNALNRELHVTIVRDDRAFEEELLQKAVMEEVGGYSNDIDHLVIRGNDSVEGMSDSAATELPLWWLGDQPGGLLIRWGKGRVLVVADPSLLTLPGLRRGDNVMFAVNVARWHALDDRIYFDEYHHGLRSGGGFWGYLRYHDEQWTIGAVMLAAAMAGWAAAIRLGRPIPKAAESRADAVDYASAVARIYERAGARHLLAQILARDFQGFLARHLRLRPTALPIEILAAWRAKTEDRQARIEDRGSKMEDRKSSPSSNLDLPSSILHPSHSPLARGFAELLRGVSELRKGDISERRLLWWMQTFDEFRQEQLARR